MEIITAISDDRPLAVAEESLVRWLLGHGNPQAAAYLPQLSDAQVESRCYCGCASINFAIGGVVPPSGVGIEILADFEWEAADGPLFGVFVFARSSLLAGLEVWSQDGLAPANMLPDVAQLRPLACPSVNENVAVTVPDVGQLQRLVSMDDNASFPAITQPEAEQ